MAERLPRVTGAAILRALERGGLRRVTQVGSHVHLKHPSRPGRVTVPAHRGKTVRLGTLNRILEQAGVMVDEFKALL